MSTHNALALDVRVAIAMSDIDPRPPLDRLREFVDICRDAGVRGKYAKILVGAYAYYLMAGDLERGMDRMMRRWDMKIDERMLRRVGAWVG